MRKVIFAALAAVGLSLSLPSAASAQGFYDPNTGQYYQYYTPYSDAFGTTYYYPGRSTTMYYYPYSAADWYVPRGRQSRTYGPGDIATTNPAFRGTDSAPYVTDYSSWYSPYRRSWYWGR